MEENCRQSKLGGRGNDNLPGRITYELLTLIKLKARLPFRPQSNGGNSNISSLFFENINGFQTYIISQQNVKQRFRNISKIAEAC